MELIRIGACMQQLFDQEATAGQAVRITAGILVARSPRLSDIAQHMAGTPGPTTRPSSGFWSAPSSKPICAAAAQPRACGRYRRCRRRPDCAKYLACW
jgi:hypothetical protein